MNKLTDVRDDVVEVSDAPMRYCFVGIGGIGMSGIAQVLNAQGHIVIGCDRKYDCNPKSRLFRALRSQGIKLFSEGEPMVDANTTAVVISSAIEESHPIMKSASEHSVEIRKRADILAELFNDKRGVAVAGTSGKTTVTAMISWVLETAMLDPTVINGGLMKNYIETGYLGNAKTGKSDLFCIETDESDGTVVKFEADVGVVMNITRDHKELDELTHLFQIFSDNTRELLIVNADCPKACSLAFSGKKLTTYGIESDADVRASNVSVSGPGAEFAVDGSHFELSVPGLHNVSNALAAISVGRHYGISDEEIAGALSTFKGVKRRLDLIGEAHGVKVFDDYSHNPAKVSAAISAMKPNCTRVIAVFQPHGYAPTRHMRDDLVSAFAKSLTPADLLFMPEIFYAGGTTDKSMSSRNLISEIEKHGVKAHFTANRSDIVKTIAGEADAGDIILSMGARDDSLTDFCYDILKEIEVRINDD